MEASVRSIARNLNISQDKVISTLRSFESQLWYVNYSYLEKGQQPLQIQITSVNEVEMDEMWSFVHDQSQPYWLWWAIDHQTGEPLAFHFGDRKHQNLDALLQLLEPFSIPKVYADDHFADASRIHPEQLETGKRHTQKIERKYLSLRTWCSRWVRKGIRFSKKHDMHRIVISLVINYWFFQRSLF